MKIKGVLSLIHNMHKTILVLLFLYVAAGQAAAQTERPWYIGLQGGTAFGQGTFRSITEHRIHPGAQGGLFAGYRLSRLISAEIGIRYGAQSQYALDCCPYWMSRDEQRYMAPVLDGQGWYYKDLRAATQWGKLSFQANLDILSLFTPQGCRWALCLSPQISAVTTSTLLVTPDSRIGHPRQWHLGWGGEASLGFSISKSMGVSLCSSITCLTGERFDNIPVHGHKSNLLWDAGIKFNYRFGL